MDWFLVVYLGLLIVIFPLIIFLSLWRYRTIRRLMQQQAEKRSGTVSGSFLLPQLNLMYQNLPVLVTSVPGNRYRHAKTEAHLTLIKPAAGSVTMVSGSFIARFGKTKGLSEVHLGFDEFDREFLIRSEDEQFVRNLFDTHLQSVLLEMKQEKPAMFLQGISLTVSVPKILKTEEGYDGLFDLAFAFADRISEL